MKIDKQLIVQLRQTTDAGFMDCKKALESNDNNLELSIKWLREKGIAKAAKKTDRVVKEGIVKADFIQNNGFILEINCETDFVARNEKFTNFINTTLKLAITKKINSVENLKNEIHEGDKIESHILALSGTLGERLELSTAIAIEKESTDFFGIYNHINSKISCITIISGNKENAQEVAKNIAMHISAINPTFISINDIEQEIITKEKNVLVAQAIEENEKAIKKVNEKIIEQRIKGRLNKILAEKCLLEQSYVKEPNLKVKDYLKNNNCEIKQFVRCEVGKKNG